jgi:hypothetical protein
MNFTSFKPFSGIPGKKDKRETFLTEGKPAPVTDARGRNADWMQIGWLHWR